MALLQDKRTDEVVRLALREPCRRRPAEPDPPHARRLRSIQLCRLGEHQMARFGVRYARNRFERLDQRLTAPALRQAVVDTDNTRARLSQRHRVIASHRIVGQCDPHRRQTGG
jgi:hypothetical protein